MHVPPYVISKREKHGFALILALAVMLLLVGIAVSLLAMSNSVTRRSAADDPQRLARSHALMALKLAIAELQMQAGPDQRITADSEIMSESPALGMTGVWRSWESSQPNHQTRDQRFLGWLVSHPNPSATRNLQLYEQTDLNGQIRLKSDGITSAESRAWLVPTIKSANQPGAYAWLVRGENRKAKINLMARSQQATSTSSMMDQHRESLASSVADPRINDHISNIESYPTGDVALSKYLTQPTLRLVHSALGTSEAKLMSRHFTPWSYGLLTNVDDGGLKKDISLASNRAMDQSAAATNPATVPSDLPPSRLLGPQSAATWEMVYDFYNHYRKRMNYVENQAFTANYYANGVVGSRARLLPILARVQWIFSYASAKLPQAEPTDPIRYKPYMRICPVLTFWNPYNATVDMPEMSYAFGRLPFEFQFNIGSEIVDWKKYEDLMGVKTVGASLGYRFFIPSGAPGELTFKPGETRVFTPEASSFSFTTPIRFRSGFRSKTGILYELKKEVVNASNQKTSVPIAAEADDSFSAAFRSISDVDTSGVSRASEVYLSGSVGNTPVESVSWIWATRMYFDHRLLKSYTETFDHVDTPEVTMEEVDLALEEPQVFGSINFQVKSALDSKFPSLGSLQTNPSQSRTDQGAGRNYYTEVDKWLPGSHHPTSSPFDLRAYVHASWMDSLLPNVRPDNRGFVASGVTALNGVPMAVLYEFPSKPLQSLVELRHANLQGNFVNLPFTMNSIGDSMASPIMPPGQGAYEFTFNSTDPVFKRQLFQNDLSYVMNDALLDEYFLSSIAPRADTWTRTPPETEADVYAKHVRGERKLPNNRYVPYKADPVNDITDLNTAYKRIGSKLMIDGMFNVNSCSEEAWSSVLAVMSSNQMLFYNPYEQTVAIRQNVTGNPERFAFSRFAIPAGPSADESLGQVGVMPNELYWRGYRSLDKAQLQNLAKEIVKEIRKRGPFLSLADFANRRLEPTSTEFSRKGALQAAIDATNINQALKNASREILPSDVASVGYSHPEAALGHTAFGAPGWLTQADVLRPILPYASVRDDTFEIIAYGEVKDTAGRVIARAKCQAIVQRFPEYVVTDQNEDADSADGNAAYENPFLPNKQANPAFNSINRMLGRRFQIVSFEWQNLES